MKQTSPYTDQELLDILSRSCKTCGRTTWSFQSGVTCILFDTKKSRCIDNKYLYWVKND